MNAYVDESAELRDIGDDASSTISGWTSANSRTLSLKLGTMNCSRGSRPGFRNSSRMSLTVNTPALIWRALTLVRS